MDAVKAAYGLDEWCERWGVSRGTAYNLVKAGKLQITKILSRSVITAEEDARFRRDQEESAGNDFATSSQKKRDVKTKAEAGRAAALEDARAKGGRRK